MKELSIEQKAKRYDEASKWMEGIYPTLTHEQQMEAEAFFPELKESKDERIKKRILLSLEKDLVATKNSGCDTKDLEKCIAWLEKQSEQKETLCDKCKKEQPHSCQDITALGRCALEKQGEQKEIDYDEELKKCKANPLYFFDKYMRVKLMPHWKPSEEQLEALKNAIHVKPSENPSDSLLWKLYEQLEKLTEEPSWIQKK